MALLGIALPAAAYLWSTAQAPVSTPPRTLAVPASGTARSAPGRESAEPLAQPVAHAAADPAPAATMEPSSPAAVEHAGVVAPSVPVAAVSSAEPEVIAQQAPDRETVLFLTIVGEQTHYHWGHAGDRPPRIDQFNNRPGGTNVAGTLIDDPLPTQSAAAEAPEPDYGPLERPLGPAPQECPRTLPAGSDQSTADALWASSRCRYLSSCTLENECTWHYQGRG
jgi:hypothetical protein